LENFIKKILAYNWLIIAVVLILTVFLGYQLRNLQMNADILSSLPDNDPDAALLKEIGKKFGSNNMGIIILESKNVYNTGVLEDVKSITDTLGTIEGILSVTSLTNIINIKSDEFGFEIGKLVDEYALPSTPEELESLKQNVLSNELYKGSIVSEDGTSTLIIFTLIDGTDVQRVAKTVISKTESLAKSGNLYYIGSPMLVTYISELMRRDLVRLLPIAFLLIAIVLFLSFKSFSGIVYPLLTAVIAIIWSLGIMSLLGYKMSMISNNIPIILLAAGTAYTIHVLNRINQIEDPDRKKAIRIALEYVMIPVILAAVTTMIGFISFIFGSYLDMIMDFGIFTALGTCFACLLSIFFIPALLSLFTSSKKNKSIEIIKERNSILSQKFLAPLNNLLFRHPKYVLITWGILIIIGLTGVFLIERSVDIKDYFKKGNPTREAENIMTEKFGGTKPIFVLFKGDMQDPDVLKKMMETGEYMEQNQDIYTTQSIADLIAEINFTMTGVREIPAEREKIEQLWFLLEGNETVKRFVSEDLQVGIIMSKFKSADNKAKKVFAKYMNDFIQANSTEACQIEITGMPFVDITMDRSLLNSQLASLTIAIIFVIIIVGFILRSLSSGMYAAIPIIAAIIILFGVMGLAGISLNIATVLVASVAIGIGIDYSIHIITHFNHSFKLSGDTKKAIGETIMISGKAIIINVISVSAGFIILVFSEMVPLQYFGFLIMLSMIVSGLGAMTLLPVILILVHQKKNNHYLSN
jgi:uncharacterized protein